MVLLHPIFTSIEGHQFIILKQEMPLIVPIMLVMLAILLIANYPLSKLIERKFFNAVPVPLKAAYWSALVVFMITFLSDSKQPFIYFQF